MGVFAGYSAHRRGQNPYFWFLIGFLFGCLGLLAFFFFDRQKQMSRKKAPMAPKPEPKIVGPRDKFWYYVDEKREQNGPMSLDALQKSWKEGKVKKSTLVWNEELPEWKPLKDLLHTTS